MKMAWLAASISLSVVGTVLVTFLDIECLLSNSQKLPIKWNQGTMLEEISPTLLTNEERKIFSKHTPITV
jgi:hypothetical protein